MNELKPCPFCGGEAVMWEHKHLQYNEYRVCCIKCHINQAGMYYFVREDAVNDWNRRVSDT